MIGPAPKEDKTKLIDEIFSSSPDSIYIYDRSLRYTYVNQLGAYLLGFKQSDMIGKTWRELGLKKEILEPIEARIKEVFVSSKPVTGEIGYPMNYGMREYEYVITPLFKHDGYIGAALVTVRDITNRKRAEREFKESERRFREMLENADLVAVMLDKEGNITFVNDFVLNITGWIREEVTGKNWFDIFIPPEQRDEIKRFFHDSVARAEIQAHYENDIVTRFGAHRTISFNNELLHDLQGNIIGTASIGQDVTEERLAEEEISASRREVLDILESITDGFLALDNLWRFTYVNKKAAEFIGKRREDLLFKVMWQVMPETVGTKFDKEYRRAKEEMIPVCFEEYYQPQRKWFEVHVYPFENGLSVYLSDITERKRAEREREELIERTQLLLASTDEGIFGFDNKGLCTFINRAASEMTGYSPEEALGKNTHELFHHSYSDGTPYPVEKCPIFNAAKTGGGIRNDSEVFWRKDGTSFPVEYSSYPIIENGEIKGAVVAFTDITERKKFEEERRRAKELSDAINSIDIVLNSTLDFDEIMQRIVAESAKALGVEAASINLREDDYWVLKYSYGLPPEVAGTRFTDDEVRASVIALESRKPVISNDAYNDERVNRKNMERFSIRSFLVTPLIMRGDAIGVLIYSYHSAPVAFTDVQIDFAERLASAASVALNNAHLYDELETRSKDLQALLDVSLDITSGLKLNELMYKIAKNATELTRADIGAVGLVDERNGVVSYPFIYNLPETIAKIDIPPGEGISGLVLARKRPLTIENYQNIPQQVPAFTEAGLRSVAIVPLFSRGRVVGTLFVSNRVPNKRFTAHDIQILEGVGRHAAIALENARLYEAESHIAKTLQESLLTIPEGIEGIDYGYLYRSATEEAQVGGDFFDIFEIEHGKVGVIIGDVSGKGIEATALTTVVKNTIKAHAYGGGTPAMIMTKTNEVVAKVSSPYIFVTVFFGVLDVLNGRLTYCSAGHPPALIKRTSGSVELLLEHSPVVGAFTGIHYKSSKATLKKGDILLLYTDGVIEARCNRKFFGEEGLVDLIKEFEPIPASNMPQLIFNTVMLCTGNKLLDDLALLAISIEPERF